MSKPRTRVPGATPWTGYGVPDPDDSARMTFWWCDDGAHLRPWPPDVRYAPMPPKYDAANKRERQYDLSAWYEDVYFEYLRQVADAIAADFTAAAERFTAEFGAVEFPRPRTSVSRAAADADHQRRRYEAVIAASRVRRGASVAQVARLLGLSWDTARGRVAAGEKLLTADPDGSRAFAAAYLRRLLADDAAEQVAAVLLDGGRLGAFRVAARLLEARLAPECAGPSESHPRSPVEIRPLMEPGQVEHASAGQPRIGR